MAADKLDVKLRISAMPAWMLGPSATFSPFLREMKEMRFQWDRPYQVDASRFKAAFWPDATRSKPAFRRLRSPFAQKQKTDITVPRSQSHRPP